MVQTHLQYRVIPPQRSRTQARFGHLVDPHLYRLAVDLADRPSAEPRPDPQPPNVLVTTSHLGTQFQPRRQPGLVTVASVTRPARGSTMSPDTRLGDDRCLKHARLALGLEGFTALRPVRQSPFDIKPRTKLGFAARFSQPTDRTRATRPSTTPPQTVATCEWMPTKPRHLQLPTADDGRQGEDDAARERRFLARAWLPSHGWSKQARQ